MTSVVFSHFGGSVWSSSSGFGKTIHKHEFHGDGMWDGTRDVGREVAVVAADEKATYGYYDVEISHDHRFAGAIRVDKTDRCWLEVREFGKPSELVAEQECRGMSFSWRIDRPAVVFETVEGTLVEWCVDSGSSLYSLGS